MENMVKMDLFNNFFKNKRVFITGHTGFKGSWLSIWLNELGADVSGYALKNIHLNSIFHKSEIEKKVNSHISDIRNYEKLKSTIQKIKPEIVFHLAAQPLVRLSYDNPRETYDTNIMGTVNLFEACRNSSSVKAIVNITSDKCYDNKEWIWGYRENDRMGGYDPYSASKGCAELITSSYINSFFNPNKYKEHGIALASVRAGNVIGGGDWAEDRLIPDCIKAIIAQEPIVIRSPDAIRPWQHVLEPLYGYLLLAQKLYSNGSDYSGAWNFGPDINNVKSVKWIVETIIDQWGDNSKYSIDENNKPHEATYLSLDCSKAKSKLKWYPAWEIKKTLLNTIEWYLENSNNNGMLDFSVSQIKRYQKDLLKEN
jgi:CDP-glucose 4,6-dehydratase